jgi:hypothetical protein
VPTDKENTVNSDRPIPQDKPLSHTILQRHLYNAMDPTDLALLVMALRQLESEGIRNTKKEQRFILSSLGATKFVEVVRIMSSQKTAAFQVLSGEKPTSTPAPTPAEPAATAAAASTETK